MTAFRHQTLWARLVLVCRGLFCSQSCENYRLLYLPQWASWVSIVFESSASSYTMRSGLFLRLVLFCSVCASVSDSASKLWVYPYPPQFGPRFACYAYSGGPWALGADLPILETDWTMILDLWSVVTDYRLKIRAIVLGNRSLHHLHCYRDPTLYFKFRASQRKLYDRTLELLQA